MHIFTEAQNQALSRGLEERSKRFPPEAVKKDDTDPFEVVARAQSRGRSESRRPIYGCSCDVCSWSPSCISGSDKSCGHKTCAKPASSRMIQVTRAVCNHEFTKTTKWPVALQHETQKMLGLTMFSRCSQHIQTE